MRKLLLLLSILFALIPAVAQTRQQRGIVRMITRTAADPIVPVQGVQVVVGNAAKKNVSDKNGHFSVSVTLNKEGSYTLTDVRIPKGKNLVWASPQKGKKQFLSKGDLDVAVASKEEKDAEYKKRYENLQAQYRAKVKELRATLNKYNDALIDLKTSDARYAQTKAECDSIQKLFADYVTNKDKIEKWMEEMAEELSLVDYQSLDSLDRRLYELKCASEWKTINDLVREFMGGDAQQAFERIKEKEQAATAEVAQKQLELAAAMQKQQSAALQRERWFKMVKANIESYKTQYLNDSVAYYYELLTRADTTNFDNLSEAGDFEREYMARYDRARNYFEAALRHAEADTLKATCYNNLGNVYSNQGDDIRAKEYYQKALKIWLAVFGEQYPDVAGSYNNLGLVYSNQGDDIRAEEYYQKALKIQFAVFGEQHPDVATTYNNLGLVYFNQDDYVRAEEYYQKSLKIKLSVLGELHPNVAGSYNNLGLVYSNQGDDVRAEECFQKSLKIQLAVLGEQHPDVAMSYSNLGFVYSNQGDYVRAEEYYRKALKIRLVVLGEQHPNVADSYSDLGDVYDSQGDYVRAEEYYQKALKIKLTVFGEQHPYLATSYNNLGLVCSNQGDYVRAEEYYQKELRIWLAVFGEQHPNVALLYGNIASCYLYQNKYAVAEEYSRKAVDILKTMFGENNPQTLLAISFLNKASCKNALQLPETAKIFMASHAITAEVFDNTPAYQRGLSGTYYVLSFDRWTVETDTTDVFELNGTLKGKPKTVVFYRGGEIREEYFENQVGVKFGVEAIDAQEKQKIVAAYRKWKAEKGASK